MNYYRQVPAVAGELPGLRDALARWALRTGLACDRSEALALASYEAMANVVEHAYVRPGAMDVEAVHLSAQNRVEVTITDRGQWLPLSGEREGGRGLPLIHRLADEAVITPGSAGTVVRMSWMLDHQG
ncbi:ATP-binding protein [Saccharopolyspora taberi]|uniref:ATP-binding protein n=1 Tax=Saccharopolyspora taberi TaxID=60895 RepID=A0ABN3VG76_9PSEU